MNELFLGLLLILLGLFFITIALLRAGAHVEGGAVLFIGPVPIVFGTSPRAALLAIAFAIVVMVVLWLLLR